MQGAAGSSSDALPTITGMAAALPVGQAATLVALLTSAGLLYLYTLREAAVPSADATPEATWPVSCPELPARWAATPWGRPAHTAPDLPIGEGTAAVAGRQTCMIMLSSDMHPDS